MFSPLFFSGMITSVSLAWEITTSNSTLLLIRFNLTWSTAAAENVCFQKTPSLPNLQDNDKWQPSFKACDSVLPFQILYDQGVITGFVWQVILKEQFLSQNLVTLFSTISWHLPQSMIWKNMNKTEISLQHLVILLVFSLLAYHEKDGLGLNLFGAQSHAALHMAHLHPSEYFENIFRSTLPNCLVISGSTRMPWPLLPSLTGWICSFKLCNRFVSRIHFNRYFTYYCLESDQFLHI